MSWWSLAITWLKIAAVAVAGASLALAFKDAGRVEHEPEKELRRAADQKKRIKDCLDLPGEVDLSIDSFGDFAGCTVKVKGTQGRLP